MNERGSLTFARLLACVGVGQFATRESLLASDDDDERARGAMSESDFPRLANAAYRARHAHRVLFVHRLLADPDYEHEGEPYQGKMSREWAYALLLGECHRPVLIVRPAGARLHVEHVGLHRRDRWHRLVGEALHEVDGLDDPRAAHTTSAAAPAGGAERGENAQAAPPSGDPPKAPSKPLRGEALDRAAAALLSTHPEWSLSRLAMEFRVHRQRLSELRGRGLNALNLVRKQIALERAERQRALGGAERLDTLRDRDDA